LYPTTDVVWRYGQSRLVEHWSRGARARAIELLDGDAVVALLATGSSTAEVLRIPEVDAAWGTGSGFRIRVTSGADVQATGNAFSICDSDEVVVTRPLAGSVFSVGGDISVEWTCASGVAVDIDIVRAGLRVGGASAPAIRSASWISSERWASVRHSTSSNDRDSPHRHGGRGGDDGVPSRWKGDA
jgi:hypothetical protein